MQVCAYTCAHTDVRANRNVGGRPRDIHEEPQMDSYIQNDVRVRIDGFVCAYMHVCANEIQANSRHAHMKK